MNSLNFQLSFGTQVPNSPVMSTSLPDTPKPKPSRVLACVLCQQRKVKCDRTFPCSNCVKHNTQCIPATQPKPRRRRFPERELLDRLRRYETLMRQSNVKFEPLHDDNITTAKSSPNDYYSDNEQKEDVRPEDRTEMVSEVKSIWQAMRQGYRDPNDSVYENVFDNAQDQMSISDEHMLFGSRQSAVELHTLHPDPAQLFRLWQIYLDNVNPLLKVTHTPTLQARIVEATSNLKEIPPTLEALMFSIYCMAVLSLSQEECRSMFKQSKEQLSTRYHFGCQQALLNCNFLRTGSRDCLTALFLYLVSVRAASHPKSISSMLAVAIRIAERMGIQSEAKNTRCSILEAELRRRLWWALVLFDSRVSALGDHKPTTLVPSWDCALPTNVSDSELREETKSPPRPQDQATEAIFPIVRGEIGEYYRNSPFYLAFTNPVMKPLAKKLPPGGDVTLEKTIEEKYLRFCDADNRIHYMTMWTARSNIMNCRLMNDYLAYLDSSTEYTPARQEAAVSYALYWLECDTKLSGSPLTKNFRWFLQLHFPFPAYIRIIQHLKGQPFSDQTEKAWKVMYDNYSVRAAPDADVPAPIFKPFTNIVLYAWDTVKRAYEKVGKETNTPKIIDFINEKVAEMSLGTGEKVGGQIQGAVAMDMDDMPMPMGFGDPSMMFDMSGQSGLGGGTPGPYMADPSSFTVDMSQLDWGSMSWGPGANQNW
ncbi:transcriptional regulatory [Fusarium longipes]|uniref:Transcriptional regulatory n=1 Tax=Fusarium longipes TaxID=694270 RepID=A0A395T040_9HYPO|nr:transcriptional regulatory [Fusarium longipes]